MKKLLIVTASILAMTTTGFAQENGADTVVAKVNETEITLGHIIALAARLPGQYETVPEEELFTGILDQLIQQELLREESKVSDKALGYMLENEERTYRAEEALNEIADNAISEDNVQAAYAAKIADIPAEPQWLATTQRRFTRLLVR